MQKKPGEGRLRKTRRFSLPIGLRLSLAFMAVILLTGLIGILAIGQISSLSNKAAELNARDLPEAITLEQLQSLLYRQEDLEHSLINGNNVFPIVSPTPIQQSLPSTRDSTHDDGTAVPTNLADLTPTPSAAPNNGQGIQVGEISSELATILKNIQDNYQRLFAFERSEQGENLSLVQQVNTTLSKTSALSEQIQTLVRQGQIAQARALDNTQQEPLLYSTISDVSQLIALEKAENANDAAQTQHDSWRSTLFVLALTAFALLLSIALAIIITRSLTRPLKSLLNTTEAIAAGNLDVDSQVKRADEIGRLASAYDKMRLSLRSSIATLSQERHQTQAIIDTIADGILLVDGEQRIVKCNPAVEYISGWRANEAIGRYYWEVLGAVEAPSKSAGVSEQLLSLMDALQTRSEQTYLEMPITARNGQQRWLAISCASMPHEEGETEQYLVIGLHDISQLKAVEQLKSDFVAMVSHELRAPLTTVAGSVEILGRLDPAAETGSYHEVLGILGQQTGRLQQVVEEVLQLTRFDAGHLEAHLQPLPISGFLRTLVDKTNAEWGEGEHYILLHEVPEETLVWADAALLQIVLRNLFENAHKYTPHGTVIEVESEAVISTGQFLLRVIDHGQGIPEDQLERIFERFSRGTQSAGNWTRGYGLGLYIARELMLAHNGSIRAENRHQGACFVLTLWMVRENPDSITEAAFPTAREPGREGAG